MRATNVTSQASLSTYGGGGRERTACGGGTKEREWAREWVRR